VSALETFGFAVALWRSLPGRGTTAAFALERLKKVWRFSAGMTAISLVVLLLTQTDKIILSKMLSLEYFAYYTLAWTVSYVILRFIGPIDAAVYPTLTRMVAQGDETGLTEVYHKSCQTQAVLMVPATLVLVLFGDAVLMIWSGDPQLTANTGPILSILAVGTCLNGFMHLPYLTQLAYGWTSLAFYQNLASVIVLIPLMVLFTQAYQGIGAAYVWVILNAGYVLISMHIMHRRILPGVKWDWYIRDIAAPTLAALVVALAAKLIMPDGLALPALAAYVLTVAGLAFLAAVLATKFPRSKLFEAARLLQRRAATKTL
jgi:O-antigen/teichoic acid export membrane protein